MPDLFVSEINDDGEIEDEVEAKCSHAKAPVVDDPNPFWDGDAYLGAEGVKLPFEHDTEADRFSDKCWVTKGPARETALSRGEAPQFCEF